MLKLTKTGIGLLTRQYRSVLKKCWLINIGIFALSSMAAMIPTEAYAVDIGSYAFSDATTHVNNSDGWCDGGDGKYLLTCVAHRNNLASVNNWQYHDTNLKYYTISTSKTIIENLEALDRVIGSYPVYSDNGSQTQVANYDYLLSQRKNNQRPFSIDAGGNISHNLITLDYAIGALPSGTYVSNMKSMGDNIKALDQAFNNYYTKGEVDSDYLHKYLKVNSTGTAASATGTDSIALGVSNTASGEYSSAFGYKNTASGNYSSAFGYKNTASGNNSSAFGNDNIASEYGTTAIGFGSRALYTESVAIGHDAFALSTYAVALGTESVASDSVVSVGHLASDLNYLGNAYGSNLFRKIINVAAGSDAHDAVIVEQLGFTIGSTGVYTGDNKVYTSVADYVSNNYYRKV